MSGARFITIEGGDGTGKSTLASSLALALRARGIDVCQTREPGGSPGAEQIRNLILNRSENSAAWSARTEALLFSAARSDHLEQTILPALKRGQWVICDRFTDSMRAYQALAGGLEAKIMDSLMSIVPAENMPDLTLLLDMPLTNHSNADLMRRRFGREADDFELRSNAFHESVRMAFLDLARAEPERIIVLNAQASAKTVQDKAMCILSEHFGLKKE